MSANGDDDIEDELREMNERLSELIELLNMALFEERAEEEELEEEGEDDLWNIGEVSEQANSVEEYKRLRKQAATSRRFTIPYFSSSMAEHKFKNYTDLYVQGYESLDSIKGALSDRAWKKVVREIFIASRIIGNESFVFTFGEKEELKIFEATEEEMALLVRKSAPDPGSFGILVGPGGDVDFLAEKSPMAVIEAYGSYWYASYPFGEFARPWRTLGLDIPADIRQALRSENVINSLGSAGILQGGTQEIETLYKQDLIPRGVRRQRNGVVDIPEVFERIYGEMTD